ncbi:hypothetical protein [Atlanticothrix silvestris]|uniref:hypothetical protein n=1 Tax=Atlanticothrix silvestris TaxID=2840444 RepID=UPI00384A72FE
MSRPKSAPESNPKRRKSDGDRVGDTVDGAKVTSTLLTRTIVGSIVVVEPDARASLTALTLPVLGLVPNPSKSLF